MDNERVDEARGTAERTVAQATDSARSEAPKVVDEARQRAKVAAGTASRALEGAAGRLRENAPRLPGGERTTHLAEGAAGVMETAADRAREKSKPTKKERIGGAIKNNPVRVAVAAAIIGAAGLIVKRKLASDPPEGEDELVA